jgi:hypothetical protein
MNNTPQNKPNIGIKTQVPVETEVHLPDSRSQTRKINIQNQQKENLDVTLSRDNTDDGLEQKDSKFEHERSMSSMTHSIAGRKLGNFSLQ